MRARIVDQSHICKVAQRRVVGEDDPLAYEWSERVKNAPQDGPVTNLEQRLVDPAQPCCAPAGEDQSAERWRVVLSSDSGSSG
jgi:hypothetical protein